MGAFIPSSPSSSSEPVQPSKPPLGGEDISGFGVVPPAPSPQVQAAAQRFAAAATQEVVTSSPITQVAADDFSSFITPRPTYTPPTIGGPPLVPGQAVRSSTVGYYFPTQPKVEVIPGPPTPLPPGPTLTRGVGLTPGIATLGPGFGGVTPSYPPSVVVPSQETLQERTNRLARERNIPLNVAHDVASSEFRREGRDVPSGLAPAWKGITSPGGLGRLGRVGAYAGVASGIDVAATAIGTGIGYGVGRFVVGPVIRGAPGVWSRFFAAGTKPQVVTPRGLPEPSIRLGPSPETPPSPRGTTFVPKPPAPKPLTPQEASGRAAFEWETLVRRAGGSGGTKAQQAAAREEVETATRWAREAARTATATKVMTPLEKVIFPGEVGVPAVRVAPKAFPIPAIAQPRTVPIAPKTVPSGGQRIDISTKSWPRVARGDEFTVAVGLPTTTKVGRVTVPGVVASPFVIPAIFPEVVPSKPSPLPTIPTVTPRPKPFIPVPFPTPRTPTVPDVFTPRTPPAPWVPPKFVPTPYIPPWPGPTTYTPPKPWTPPKTDIPPGPRITPVPIPTPLPFPKPLPLPEPTSIPTSGLTPFRTPFKPGFPFPFPFVPRGGGGGGFGSRGLSLKGPLGMWVGAPKGLYIPGASMEEPLFTQRYGAVAQKGSKRVRRRLGMPQVVSFPRPR